MVFIVVIIVIAGIVATGFYMKKQSNDESKDNTSKDNTSKRNKYNNKFTLEKPNNSSHHISDLSLPHTVQYFFDD
jgi:FtsZ-interacting cell division protein ZipA